MILFYLPKWTNMFFFYSKSEITSADVTMFKSISYLVDFLFFLAWIIASAYNKASITDIDIDPEELESDEDWDSEEEEGDRAWCHWFVVTQPIDNNYFYFS